MRTAAAASSSVRTTEGLNAFVLALDASAIKCCSSARTVVDSLKAPSGGKKGELVSKGKWRFHAESPNWKSDIRWVSAADTATFEGLFQPLFERLAVAEHFRFCGEMVMFSGFFVLRRETKKSHFHKDFTDTGNKAFTMMIPLCDMSTLSDCHLLCRVPSSSSSSSTAEEEPELITKQYRYKFGEEAIVFGDGFEHATETGSAPSQLAFLCFTFGDRRCTDEEWQNAKAYIGEQGPIHRDPSGRFGGSGVV